MLIIYLTLQGWSLFKLSSNFIITTIIIIVIIIMIIIIMIMLIIYLTLRGCSSFPQVHLSAKSEFFPQLLFAAPEDWEQFIFYHWSWVAHRQIDPKLLCSLCHCSEGCEFLCFLIAKFVLLFSHCNSSDLRDSIWFTFVHPILALRDNVSNWTLKNSIAAVAIFIA